MENITTKTMLRTLSITIAFILIIGIAVFLIFPKSVSPSISSIIGSEAVNLQQSQLNAEPVLLSPDISFPTPVVQLQQTVAHGLIAAERVDLPLLSGELAEFSQENIREKYPSPPELEDLKQRLKKLQSLSQ